MAPHMGHNPNPTPACSGGGIALHHLLQRGTVLSKRAGIECRCACAHCARELHISENPELEALRELIAHACLRHCIWPFPGHTSRLGDARLAIIHRSRAFWCTTVCATAISCEAETTSRRRRFPWALPYFILQRLHRAHGAGIVCRQSAASSVNGFGRTAAYCWDFDRGGGRSFFSRRFRCAATSGFALFRCGWRRGRSPSRSPEGSQMATSPLVGRRSAASHALPGRRMRMLVRLAAEYCPWRGLVLERALGRTLKWAVERISPLGAGVVGGGGGQRELLASPMAVLRAQMRGGAGRRQGEVETKRSSCLEGEHCGRAAAVLTGSPTSCVGPSAFWVGPAHAICPRSRLHVAAHPADLRAPPPPKRQHLRSCLGVVKQS